MLALRLCVTIVNQEKIKLAEIFEFCVYHLKAFFCTKPTGDLCKGEIFVDL